MIPAYKALTRLRDGNRRFVDGASNRDTLANLARRRDLVTGQQPFAVILGCSDSRVPAEIIFDQGLGDLFVIRIAGNVVHSSQIGSVEYAAETLGTRLVVVMGHSDCGAITAALELIRSKERHLSANLNSIIDSIRPAVEGVVGKEQADGKADPRRQTDPHRQTDPTRRATAPSRGTSNAPGSVPTLLAASVRANIRHSVETLRHGSDLIEDLVQRDSLQIVGAEYSLKTGAVSFLDE